MQNTPLVSVICLCYNHEKFVEEALNSVINQNYTNIELIIVDDFSIDNSVGIIANWLKKHPEINFISNQKNIGNTKSFNQAKAISKGNYLLDLAADDFLETDAIENLIKPFLENEKLGIVYGNSKWISEKNEFIKNTYNTENYKKAKTTPKSGNIYEEIIGQKIELNSVASLVKRDVFDVLNAYDENLMYEDLDLWFRASRIYPFEYVDKIITNKRVLENSLGNQFFKPFNSRARKLNRTTFSIILKAVKLNNKKSENSSLLRRVHYEMEKCIKNYDLILFCKYALIELKLRFHLNLKKE